MSITFLKFACTQCDFRGNSLVTFGLFRYLDGGRYFIADRTAGLCLDCKQIAPIEKLPSTELYLEAAGFRKSYKGPPLFAYREKNEAHLLGSRENFDILEKIIELNRQPVCFACGGTSIRQFVLPNNICSSAWYEIDQGHPWCAGKLKVSHSGTLRIAPAERNLTFDIYGQSISSGPNKPHPFDIG